MSQKSEKILTLTRSVEGSGLDPHYLGYFECFNQQRFFEAHEVLEALWLPQRGQAKDHFYKGLIQLAGAFVHVQKKRRQPAIALFRLAGKNLREYPSLCDSLDLAPVHQLIESWITWLETQSDLKDQFGSRAWPKLALTFSDSWPRA